MGFRGEALASIAAISNVELVTRTEEDEIGHKIVLEGGDVLEKTETGAQKGTTITVTNLFYNTPVRYKFLKKDYTELRLHRRCSNKNSTCEPKCSNKIEK